MVHFSSIQGEFPSNGLTATLATNAEVICLVLWNVEILLFLPRLYIFWKVSNLFDSFVLALSYFSNMALYYSRNPMNFYKGDKLWQLYYV